jgi:hypothetical protein
VKAFLVLALAFAHVAAASPSFGEPRSEKLGNNGKQIEPVKKPSKQIKKSKKPDDQSENCRFILDYRCPRP